MADKKTAEQLKGNEDGLMTLKEASAYADVTAQRIRTLLREGRVNATKNERGHWRVSREAIDAYNASKGQRKGGKAWVIRVEPEQLETVRELLAGYGIEMEPRYKPRKKSA